MKSTIEKSMDELRNLLGQDKNIVCMGIGKTEIFIYVKKHKKGYPDVINGFPITVKKIGRLIANGK